MIGGQLADAVAQPNIPRALTGRGEERLRSRRVRIFLEKMVLHLPRMIVAEFVRKFDLRQRILIQRQLIAGMPRARQLKFVEYPKFHRSAPVVSLPTSTGRIAIIGWQSIAPNGSVHLCARRQIAPCRQTAQDSGGSRPATNRSGVGTK